MRRKKARTHILDIFLFLAVVGIILTLYIWNSAVIDRLTVEVGVLEKRLNQLKIERHELETRYNRLTSIEHIGRVAREKLKMKFPDRRTKPVIVEK